MQPLASAVTVCVVNRSAAVTAANTNFISERSSSWAIQKSNTTECSGGSSGQDAKSDSKARGQLPAKWNKLGLTDQQKQKVYSIQSSYRAKVQDLEAKIKDLRKHERTEMEAVLTDAQKTRLRELLLEKAPAPESPPPSKPTKG